MKDFCVAFVSSSLLMLFVSPSCLAEFDHSLWDELLQTHVVSSIGGKATQIDYAAMKTDSAKLHDYLLQLSKPDKENFDSWPQNQQLAFLINLYNAATVNLVLSEYPDLESIKDLGSIFRSPWSKAIVSVFGEQVSLDDVEHEMIRGWGRYLEPRIHFAVNCAAIGCPALRAEAYTGDKLEQQLDDNTRLFLADRSRNYFSAGRLYISRIFDWYKDDFEQGWSGVDSVHHFLARYAEALGLDQAQLVELLAGNIRLVYLPYDWRLNRLEE